MAKVTSFSILAKVYLGAVLESELKTEMKIWYVRDMHFLKVVSSEKCYVMGDQIAFA